MIVDLLPAIFVDTKQLQELYVSDNSLTQIHPNLLLKNTHLRIFDAANNRIRFLPPDLFMYNTKLMEVYVHGNELSFLSNEQFQHNPELKTVHLENNNIIFLQLGTFGYSIVPMYINFSNNAIQHLQSNTNCHMAIMNVNYEVGRDSLCQTHGLGEMVTIDIRGNPLFCDNLQEEVAVLCCNYSRYIVRKCAFGTTRISSAEFKGRRLQKREVDVTSLSEKANGLAPSSTPVTSNYSVTADPPSVTDTAIHFQDIEYNMSSDSSVNMTQLFGQAYQLVTILPSEETAQNLTRVAILIHYNSSLVVNEGITRGMLLIGAETILAVAIILRKIVCSRFKQDTDVERMELVSIEEAGAVRLMERCENGKLEGNDDNNDITFVGDSEKRDDDD
jgi:hypothetical protein